MIAAVPQPPTENASGSTAAHATKRKTTSPLAAVVLYLLIVFVGAAVVAPRFHATAQFLFQEVNWRFGRLARQPFDRFMYGTIVLLAVIALPSLLKSLQIRIADLGLKSGLRHFGEGIQGMAWAVVSFLLLSALLIASNIRILDPDNSARWVNSLKYLVVLSFGLALLTELVFRGALFTAFRRHHRVGAAALLSGAFSALLPFLEKPQNPARIEWDSGFAVLGQMLGAFTNSEALIPALLNLIVAGALLALAFERTGALHFSVGLHTGLIFCFKSFALLTSPAAKESSSFWGSDRLIDGWAATVVLLLIFLLIERTLPPRKEPEP